MRRGLIVVGAALAASALVAGGWFTATAFTSPAQRAAASAPPAPKPIIAQVARGDLDATGTLPGAVQAESRASVPLNAQPGAARSVVTASPLTAGSRLNAGDVVARVNGAPEFAVMSPFPFYRDLGVGDEGPDVLELQRSLVTRGVLGAADGTFGAATAQAVAAQYRDAGDTAPVRPDPTPSGAATGTATTIVHSSAYLPYAAVIAIAALPAHVAAVPIVGADAASATLGIASARLIARASVPDDARAVVTAGAQLACTIGGTAVARCRVLRVFDSQTDGGPGNASTGAVEAGAASATAVRYADLVPADGSAIPASAAGAPASATVTLRHVATAALLVPQTAVSGRGGSAAVVLRRGADGAFAEVPVTVLGSADGQVAVTGALQQGDAVRIG